MRILVVGGSGLIGAHVVDVLRERGHGVTSVARTMRDGVDRVLDCEVATQRELREVLQGHDAVVYAARTDEQQALPKPIYPAFRSNLVDPLVRLFAAARDEGLTGGVIMGSYYTYFQRVRPQWDLAGRHVYVRCRVEQAREARVAAGPELPVAVLELPFVVGRAGDRLPNWVGQLDRWARSRAPLVAPAGGTAVVSARSVAEIAADAVETASGADIPVADENLTWHEMIARIAAATGHGRRVRRLPAGVVRAATTLGGLSQALARKESGLNPVHAADLFLKDLFVEPVTGKPLDTAFGESFG
ncbi:hypothetical protein GCM10010435_22230 [Winogradskya consettensis]|uniref:NAD-dependent epimerase/dehydratase domain-containing protein n=1 Tax=Winogradskya consettensis TaxID=113560 RepID=A0A919T5K6_9ACTN|nr:NAD-dependent epimerase/dehydratase family protein [Actinoplanes consettensis]GIM85179.1 hypothetical protein Aco04nite_94940 [Actinoplanes consettensis]